MAISTINISVNDTCNGKILSLVKDVNFEFVGDNIGSTGFTLPINQTGQYSKRVSELSNKNVSQYKFLRATLKTSDGKDADTQTLEVNKAKITGTSINFNFVFNCDRVFVKRDATDLISENISSGTDNKSQTVATTNSANKSQVNQNLPPKKK